MAALRHTATLPEKINALCEAIPNAIATGETMKAMIAKAERMTLTRDSAQVMFDKLFPEAPKDASSSMQTRAKNARHEALLAAALPMNNVGGIGNVATLWNAATFLVDRNANGTARKMRGESDALNSMLLGERGKRVAQIQNVIEVVMRDGTVAMMTAPEAIDAGCDAQSVSAKISENVQKKGAQLLAEMLG
jgi:hypothetical protein